MNVRPHSAHTPPANPCGQLVPLWLTVTAAAARLRLYRDEFPHPFLRARRRFFGHGGATTATAGDWSIAPLTRCVSGSTTCRRNDPPSLLGTRLLCRSSRSRQLLRDPARRHGHARTACRGCEERRGGPARPRPRRVSPRRRSAPACCSLPSLRSPPRPWREAVVLRCPI